MCGILGEIRFNGRIHRQSFSQMLGELAARGPDATAIQYLGDDSLAFGHQRLSVIDLTDSASQPMANEDGTVWLVFNGEIYNYRSLRQELLGEGHRFKSQSDSEVILHAYEQWGEACVDRLEGMFAFAVWDSERRRLFLARDHLGIKPIYYWKGSTCFVFASQPRAILEHPEFSRSIDREALQHYLAYRYVPGELAIYEGMRKLPAGHWLMLSEKDLETRRFWQVSYRPEPLTPGSACTLIQTELRRSVEAQLVSDVPVGIWLSGGIDSSTIAAIAARESNGLPCFTIGFDDEPSDERRYAREAAKWLGCPIHEEVVTARDAVTLLPEVIDAFDEPFFDHSAIPTYAVSRLSRKYGIKVTLSGDGGDELFAGYLWYDAFFKNRNHLQKLRDFFNLRTSAPESALKKFFGLTGYLDAEAQAELLGTRSAFNHLALLKRHFDPELPAITALQIMDVNTFLVDDVLTKVDRASMACGVEVRVPFLDVGLVDSAFSIPHDLVYSGGERKSLLKRAASDLLGSQILTPRKKGFSVPLRVWMKQGLAGLVRHFVPNGLLVKMDVLQAGGVKTMMESGDSRTQWLLLSLELWARRWMDGDMPDCSYLATLLSEAESSRVA